LYRGNFNPPGGNEVSDLKRTLHEASMLTRLAGIINSSLDIETVLDQSMKCVENFLDAEASSIFEIDKDSGNLFFRFVRGSKGSKAKEIRLKMGEGVAGWVAQTGESTIVSNVETDERFSKSVDNKTGFKTKTILCVPLKIHDEVVGALQVLNKKNNRTFTEADIELLTSFGDQIAIALNNAKLYEQVSNNNQFLEKRVKERTSELSLLLEISTTISSTLDIDQILQILVEKLSRRIATTFCRIFFLDRENNSITVQAAHPTRKLEWTPEIGKDFPLDHSYYFNQVVETKRSFTIYGDKLKKIIKNDNERRLLTGCIDNLNSALLIPLVRREKILGVISLGESRKWDRSPFDSRKIRLCKAIANQAAVAIENARLFEKVKKKNKELRETYFQSMKVLAQSIEEKDKYTKAHSERMIKNAELLVEKLGLPEYLKEPVKFAALLHDIGKIDIPDAILGKKAALAEAEQKQMKTHPARGAGLIKNIKFLKPVVPMILHHHERWDGKGYPKGLKGEEIPIGARIVCILDTFDAITSNRPYSDSRGKEWAIAELKECSGTQFDPEVVDAFIEILTEEDKKGDWKVKLYHKN
jgi:HD-GYP domain-containing protein (c-di-GMP phosphodiesterase class II)